LSAGVVAELWRFPVKSMQGERIDGADVTEAGFAGDRAFALVDVETGKVASAKLPRLWGALLQCQARTDGGRVAITLGDGTETATDDPDVHARLSAYLGREVELTTKAPASNRYLAAWPEIDGVMPDADRQAYGIGDDPDGTLTDFALAMAAPKGTFFDVSSLHVVARATLDRLGEVQPGTRFAVERYRPNVVVDGFEAFAENAWGTGATLQLGGVTAAGVIPTMRCIMTTLAQGDLPRDNEVLRTITKTNRIEIPGMGTWSCVGSYAAVTAGGRIAVGDEVVVS
jgi:uncharacterized protein YcbX